MRLAQALVLGLSLFVAQGLRGAHGEAVTWPGDFVTRLEALALVETLNAELLASRSATLTLEKWCGEHRLARDGEAKIVAKLIRGDSKPASAEQRARLAVGADEQLNYRRVQLVCGDRVLSEADNWYVPSRLTPEMNRLLETTDTPFGKAVLPLKPFRQTFAARLLWRPLPQGWETQPTIAADNAQPMTIPDALFEHEALVHGSGQPISEVHETYQGQLLAFPLPKPQ
jgi:hypothetical protein